MELNPGEPREDLMMDGELIIGFSAQKLRTELTEFGETFAADAPLEVLKKKLLKAFANWFSERVDSGQKISALKVKQLRSELAKRNQPTDGVMKVLASRLFTLRLAEMYTKEPIATPNAATELAAVAADLAAKSAAAEAAAKAAATAAAEAAAVAAAAETAAAEAVAVSVVAEAPSPEGAAAAAEVATPPAGAATVAEPAQQDAVLTRVDVLLSGLPQMNSETKATLLKSCAQVLMPETKVEGWEPDLIEAAVDSCLFEFSYEDLAGAGSSPALVFARIFALKKSPKKPPTQVDHRAALKRMGSTSEIAASGQLANLKYVEQRPDLLQGLSSIRDGDALMAARKKQDFPLEVEKLLACNLTPGTLFDPHLRRVVALGELFEKELSHLIQAQGSETLAAESPQIASMMKHLRQRQLQNIGIRNALKALAVVSPTAQRALDLTNPMADGDYADSCLVSLDPATNAAAKRFFGPCFSEVLLYDKSGLDNLVGLAAVLNGEGLGGDFIHRSLKTHIESYSFKFTEFIQAEDTQPPKLSLLSAPDFKEREANSASSVKFCEDLKETRKFAEEHDRRMQFTSQSLSRINVSSPTSASINVSSPTSASAWYGSAAPIQAGAAVPVVAHSAAAIQGSFPGVPPRPGSSAAAQVQVPGPTPPAGLPPPVSVKRQSSSKSATHLCFAPILNHPKNGYKSITPVIKTWIKIRENHGLPPKDPSGKLWCVYPGLTGESHDASTCHYVHLPTVAAERTEVFSATMTALDRGDFTAGKHREESPTKKNKG
jgi:hypothetical protein